MRVLHYIPNFSMSTETFIYDQVTALEKAGIESAVVTAKRVNEQSRPFELVYFCPIKTVINERFTQAFALRLQLLPYMIDYKRWQEVIDEFKPDVVHCHTGNGVKTWMHVSEKLNLNIPTLASLHGSDVNSEPLIRAKYRAVLKKAGSKDFIKWTVPSEFLKRKTVENLDVPREKITVVHNSFNSMFLSTKQEKSFDTLNIVSVGRLINCKGHEFLIRALAVLHKDYPNATLTLIGGGELKEHLQGLTDQLALTKHVKFIDMVSHQALPDLLSSYNVYAQPSIRDDVTFQEESFGVAALEAMASGLATVVSECGGLTELVSLVDTPAVKVVPQRDPESLAGAIAELYKNEASLTLAQRHKLAELFSIDMNTASIKRLYSELTQ